MAFENVSGGNAGNAEIIIWVSIILPFANASNLVRN